MPKIFLNINKELKYELLGITLTALGIIAFISLLGFSTGPIGQSFAKIQRYCFGIGAYLLPLMVMMIGIRYIIKRLEIVYSLKFFGIITFYLSALAIYHHFKITPGAEIMPESLTDGGGIISGFIVFFLRKIIGVDGAIIVLFTILICALLLITNWSLALGLLKTKKIIKTEFENTKEALSDKYQYFNNSFDVEANTNKSEIYNQENDIIEKKINDKKVKFPIIMENDSVEIKEIKQSKKEKIKEAVKPPTEIIELLDNVANDGYILPSIFNILNKVEKPKNTKLTKEIVDNAKLLEETLESFNVKAKVVNATAGPAVTRYELEPAAGVKVSKIVNLADDLALKLAAPGIRIEAPIPGKAAIGIEVPNKNLVGVQLREVLESENFQQASSKLSVGLGKDIAGQVVIADLAKMPHLLVAGATGSGKSVCINTLITSILFKAKPDEVKFILIDPKMVELSNYNGIPHLMIPVVTDSRKAAAALNWAVHEMEKRYALFAANGVRDMERFNKNNNDNKMPSIVIIIDELADLMMVAPGDVEDAICRLAQKARAAGLHLVLATQRPSVDVITGIIKANVPSRISFSVSSQIDSRTILDMGGAEKLLGKGDMLYNPVGFSKPLRVQGAFISDSEVELLLDFIKKQGEPEINEEIISFTEETTSSENSSNSESTEFTDELLQAAINMVFETGQASVSMLQRKFRIGYTRAGRLVDTIENMKIVGPNIGSKPREILMTREQVNTMYFDV